MADRLRDSRRHSARGKVKGQRRANRMKKPRVATDCRQCEHCEISEYLANGKIAFSCLVMEVATNHCVKFKKGTPKEVEWINGN